MLTFIKEHASDDTTIDSVRRAVNERFGLSLEYQQVKGIFFRFHLPYKRNVRHNVIMTDRVPIGSIRKHGDYWMIKVRDGKLNDNWQFLHHHIWEKEHGPLPEGYRLMFRDMNPDNVILDNLVMVSIKDAGVAAMKYGLTNDPEINDAIFNVTKLRRITKEKADNGEN